MSAYRSLSVAQRTSGNPPFYEPSQGRARGKEKPLSRRRLRSTSRAKEALLRTVDAPSWVARPAWLRVPGLRWCKHREWPGADPEGRRRWPNSKSASTRRRGIGVRRTGRLAGTSEPDGADRRRARGLWRCNRALPLQPQRFRKRMLMAMPFRPAAPRPGEPRRNPGPNPGGLVPRVHLLLGDRRPARSGRC